ncbi:MAG: HPr family phosphocarrier protein [Clostridia bacterium]|nr:HPr family phosphocarrier protein [Clostridia bacterium]MBQ9253086.1 HPr family phosphocarrier protein [Clostridia bacterium]
MKTVQIRLSLVENVNKFVNIVGRYPFDMDLRAGRHVVDAKSILGIFSLDLSRAITLEIYSDDCDDLLKEIQPFVVAQE